MSLRRCLLVLTAAVALQTVPSLAGNPAGPVKAVVHSTLLTATDTVTKLTDERLVGVTWDSGTADVRLRWHTPQGWGAWETAEPDPSDEGRPGTEPQWRPPAADGVQVRTDRPGLRLVTVADGVVRKVRGAVAEAATGRAALGEVHSRAGWGADESIRRGAPKYAGSVVAVTVHHTANHNGYRPSDVPAIIRADYAYHVQGRGWGDLGYNLLVDQFGGIWEGRYGGLGRATIGSHAQGFNVGTLGVAMIGDLTSTTASLAAERALAKVVAYASSTWHFNPTATVRIRSGGSPRYPDGRVVTLPRVFGHGQTSVTQCPGSLQSRLTTIAALSKRVLAPAPRIVRTSVDGVPVHTPTPATISGKLSESVSWMLTLYDDQQTLLAAVRGTHDHPALSWDGTRNGLPVLPGSTVSWRLVASDGFHDPAIRTGSFEVGLPSLTYRPATPTP